MGGKSRGFFSQPIVVVLAVCAVSSGYKVSASLLWVRLSRLHDKPRLLRLGDEKGYACCKHPVGKAPRTHDDSKKKRYEPAALGRKQHEPHAAAPIKCDRRDNASSVDTIAREISEYPLEATEQHRDNDHSLRTNGTMHICIRECRAVLGTSLASPPGERERKWREKKKTRDTRPGYFTDRKILYWLR